MQRWVTFWLAAASLATFVVGAGVVVAVSATHGNLNSLAFGLDVTALLAGVLCGAAAWLLGMMRAAGMRRWDWFIAVLALGPVGALLYSRAHVEASALA
jgi:hypothetical protein